MLTNDELNRIFLIFSHQFGRKFTCIDDIYSITQKEMQSNPLNLALIHAIKQQNEVPQILLQPHDVTVKLQLPQL